MSDFFVYNLDQIRYYIYEVENSGIKCRRGHVLRRIFTQNRFKK